MSKFEELLENSSIEELVIALNSEVDKVLGESGSDIFEIYLESILGNSMYVSNYKDSYALEYVNGEARVTEGLYGIRDGSVSVSLIEKMREMAYMGYNLRQNKEAEVEEIGGF